MNPPGTTGMRLLRFMARVLRAFSRNRGLLLAGGVGYNALLSAVPLLAVTVTGLSFLVDEALILRTIEVELGLLFPRHSDALVEAVRAFLGAREVVGLVGFGVLLFFSSMAFRMLEEAIGAIFGASRVRRQRRSIWFSVLLPYVYIGALVLALLAITLLNTGLDALGPRTLAILGWGIPLAAASGALVRLLTFTGLVLLFTSIYRVFPVVRVALGRAAVGGLCAAALWEVAGRALAYYFARISLVGVVYGSLATVVVVLISMEVAAIILLLGAQVIAELEASSQAGVPWHEQPPGEDPGGPEG